MKSVITKKQIVITATLCLLAAAQASAKEILVAQVAAFTGAQASSGKAIRAGISLYLNHVNSHGGIAGDRIRLVTYDDGYKAEETVRLVKQVLVKEAPLAFVGVLGPRTTRRSSRTASWRAPTCRWSAQSRARAACWGAQRLRHQGELRRRSAQAVRDPVPHRHQPRRRGLPG
jgi:hypothetical protein